MPLLYPNPQTFSHPRIKVRKLLAIANSNIPWSVTKTREYADIKGIDQILELPLGTDPNIWQAVSGVTDPQFYIDRVRSCVDAINERISLMGFCHGIIAGPGVPCRTWLYTPNAGTYFNVSFLGFLANAPSIGPRFELGESPVGVGNFIGGNYNAGWWAPVGMSGLQYNLEQPKEPLPLDGGLATWRFRLNYPSTTLASSITNFYEAYTYKPEATTRFGRDNNTLPIGRVGWASGYRSPAQGSETAATCLNATYSWEAAKNLASQSGPILVALDNTSSSYNDNHAQLIDSLRLWGFSVSWYYRLGSPQSLQASIAPEAGAAFTRTAFESGTITDYPCYVHIGIGANADVPGNQLMPSLGGGAHLAGQSNSNDWGYRCLARGGSWMLLDSTHRANTDRDAQISFYWHLLTGMSVMEAVYWSQNGFSNHQIAMGDPLAAPFWYRRAPSLSSHDETSPLAYAGEKAFKVI